MLAIVVLVLWHFEFGKSCLKRLESVFRFASVTTIMLLSCRNYYPIDNLVSEVVIVSYFNYILLVLHICITNSQRKYVCLCLFFLNCLSFS